MAINHMYRVMERRSGENLKMMQGDPSRLSVVDGTVFSLMYFVALSARTTSAGDDTSLSSGVETWRCFQIDELKTSEKIKQSKKQQIRNFGCLSCSPSSEFKRLFVPLNSDESEQESHRKFSFQKTRSA